MSLDESKLCLAVDKAQQADSTLDKCRSAAWEGNVAPSVTYLVDNCVLVRKWTPKSGMECEMVDQVVVPEEFHLQVLNLAHDH